MNIKASEASRQYDNPALCVVQWNFGRFQCQTFMDDRIWSNVKAGNLFGQLFNKRKLIRENGVQTKSEGNMTESKAPNFNIFSFNINTFMHQANTWRNV